MLLDALGPVRLGDEERNRIDVKGRIGIAPVAAGARELQSLPVTVVGSGTSAHLGAGLLLGQTPGIYCTDQPFSFSFPIGFRCYLLLVVGGTASTLKPGGKTYCPTADVVRRRATGIEDHMVMMI